MKKNQQQPIKTNQDVSFWILFRFSDPQIIIYIVIGTVAAFINGIIQPIFHYLQGMMYGAFTTLDKNLLVDRILNFFIYIMLTAIIGFLSSWVMYSCWMIAGEKLTMKCKKIYLKSILSQQVGWFDLQNQSQLSSMFHKSTVGFNQAIGQRFPSLISIISLLIGQLLIPLIQGWQLGLVVSTILPVFYISMLLFTKYRALKSMISLTSYKEVDGKAQEILSSIKTVKSMNGQQHQFNKYQTILKNAYATIIKYIVITAIATSLSMLVTNFGQALAYWYGSELLINKTLIFSTPYNTGIVFGIILVILGSNQIILQLDPAITKIGQGKYFASQMYRIIDRVPLLDKNENGIKLNDNEFKGVIKFQNVKFAYPKQPNKIILQNLSFELLPNQRVAFVGESGSGKSTITQLIMRFYDPLEGKITLDGIELNKLNLHWLRSKIGYVSQQPVLFATSIRQNLLMAKPDATQEQLIQALKLANAYDFTMQLQNKLDTFVGEGGAQLSGGQKQRVAIARALLKKGKIIMFDQATSALDMNNEILIQQTLQKISGMTTINIAHRVNTIKNSDVIFVIAEGRVKESGKFHQLEKFKNINFTDLNTQKKINLQANLLIKKKQEKIIVQKIQNTHQELNQKYQTLFYQRLLFYNTSNKVVFILGCILQILNTVLVLVSRFFNGFVTVAIIQRELYPNKRISINIYCYIYMGLGVVFVLVNVIRTIIFSIIGENLNVELKIDSFKKLLKLPISWFDNPQNRKKLNVLPKSFTQLNSVVTQFTSVSIRTIVYILVSLIVGFYYDWKLTLISLVLLPLFLFSAVFQARLIVMINQKIAKEEDKNLINEGILNIRTVYSVNCVSRLEKQYDEELDQIYIHSRMRAHLIGVSYGLSMLLLYVATGFLMYISSIFLKANQLSLLDSVVSRSAVIQGAFLTAISLKLFPDFVGGKMAAINIFKILDEEDEEQIQIRQNSRKLEQGYYKGDIEIKNLNFKYPQRNTEIFKNFNMKIKGGSKVAFVGESGAGKSTILQILLRFYEPESGEVLIDGINIKDFEIHYLRSLFGVVSQQPVLFNTSFKQNIQYNKYDATQQDIIMAAKSAQAYNFIEGNEQLEGEDVKEQGDSILSKGFDRNVGLKGSHISGGQKQRVAIARIILRKPKIILLDEATSALDKTNEKLVQSALDRLMMNKTSITIAHRLDTIRHSDNILVIKAGKIVQEGTYNQLITSKGQLYQLEGGVFLNYSQ